MNQENLHKYRNKIEIAVVKRLSIKRNVVNLNTHNSWQHEMIKTRICYELQKLGKHFITEAPLSFKGREGTKADILVLDDAQAIEVMVSETEQQLQYKSSKYPACLEVIGVRDWEDAFVGKYLLIKRGII